MGVNNPQRVIDINEPKQAKPATSRPAGAEELEVVVLPTGVTANHETDARGDKLPKAELNQVLQMGLEANDSPEVEAVRAQLKSGNQYKPIQDFARQLGADARSLIDSSSSANHDGSVLNTPSRQNQWAGHVNNVYSNFGGIDVNSLIIMVLREAYEQTNLDLMFHYNKVKFYNEVKKNIRDEVNRARQALRGAIDSGAAEETDNLPETIIPQHINKSFSGALTEEEIAAQQAEMEAAAEAAENEPEPEPVTVSRDAREVSYDRTLQATHFAGGYDKDYGPEVEKFIEKLMLEYRDMSPDERKAFEEELRKNGMSFEIGTSITNGGERYRDTLQADRMYGSENFQSYIERVLPPLMREHRAETQRRDGGTPWLTSVSFTANFPAFLFEELPGGTERAAGSVEFNDGEPITTRGALEDYIEKLEQDMNSVGDDAQLAKIDLQNMLQKQQQTLQLMSNVIKMLHDTALSIIRKIGQ